MCSILVDIDAFDVFAVEVSSSVRTFVYYEAALAFKTCEVCIASSVQAGSDYEIIVLFHYQIFLMK